MKIEIETRLQYFDINDYPHIKLIYIPVVDFDIKQDIDKESFIMQY